MTPNSDTPPTPPSPLNIVSNGCHYIRGIGLELCRQLQARGDCVLAICRKASPELKQLAVDRVIEGIDVS